MTISDKLIPSLPEKASSESFAFTLTTTVTAAFYAILAVIIGGGQYFLSVTCDFKGESERFIDKYCTRHLYVVTLGSDEVDFRLDFYPWMSVIFLILAATSLISK